MQTTPQQKQEAAASRPSQLESTAAAKL